MIYRGFASDNNAGVHPRIMQALTNANQGHCKAYGDDPYTQRAEQLFKEHFGQQSEVFFIFNGTAANVLSLQALSHSYHAIICADTAHIHVDECGAPERFTGCKLLDNPASDGKLTIADIEKHLHLTGFEHHVQPKVISITQSTEMGTVYSVDELKEIAAFAHRHQLLLHVDGARIANAAAYLNTSFKELVTDTGVDILSFGGTKNGLMYGEAIVVLNPEYSLDFKYIRKQGMQLASKMRYIAAQFEAYLSGDLYLENARNANKMARLLHQKAGESGVRITQKVEANEVFAVLPSAVIRELQETFFFYMWDESKNEVRWVCSWDTTEDDVLQFTSVLKKALNKYTTV
ncbi:MAG: low specificity L-threonine aldolase [Bacteroidales bacterium]|nr:low specificity L-threonine aldolase [Bacteroidales bacterium]